MPIRKCSLERRTQHCLIFTHYYSHIAGRSGCYELCDGETRQEVRWAAALWPQQVVRRLEPVCASDLCPLSRRWPHNGPAQVRGWPRFWRSQVPVYLARSRPGTEQLNMSDNDKKVLCGLISEAYMTICYCEHMKMSASYHNRISQLTHCGSCCVCKNWIVGQVYGMTCFNCQKY